MSTATPLEDLLSITKLDRNFGETNPDFSRRLYEHIKVMDDDGWNEIGDRNEAAQEWYNQYHHALMEGKRVLPLVPGMGNGMSAGEMAEFNAASEEDEEETAQESVSESRPKKTRAKREKKEKAPKAKRSAGELTRLLRKMMLDNPARSSKDMQLAVENAGFAVKLSTIATTRAGLLGALVALKDNGYYTHPGLDSFAEAKNSGADESNDEEE